MSFSEDFIASEYRRLGYALGWRFLTCPARNIETASVALVTINPGGDVFEPPRWSVENGSAYVIESWKGCAAGEEDLQRQVRRMFEVMAVDPAEVLSGYLVPFRSPEWDQLPRQTEALNLGVTMWREVFERARVTTVVVFGKKAGHYVAQVLDARPAGSIIAHWGDETIDTHHFGHNGKMLVLPHLSRFSLFHRASSEAAFRPALAGEAESLASAAPLPGPMPRSGRYGPNDVIHLIVPGNPKISNRKSILRFDCYRDGMALAEYEAAVLAALGADEAAKCRKDLRWDTEHNFIQIERR